MPRRGLSWVMPPRRSTRLSNNIHLVVSFVWGANVRRRDNQGDKSATFSVLWRVSQPLH